MAASLRQRSLLRSLEIRAPDAPRWTDVSSSGIRDGLYLGMHPTPEQVSVRLLCACEPALQRVHPNNSATKTRRPSYRLRMITGGTQQLSVLVGGDSPYVPRFNRPRTPLCIYDCSLSVELRWSCGHRPSAYREGIQAFDVLALTLPAGDFCVHHFQTLGPGLLAGKWKVCNGKL